MSHTYWVAGQIEGKPAARTIRTRAIDCTKRVLDIVGSMVGLILSAPFFLLIAWQVRRDSPGPIFYRGARLGKDGKVFNIIKFRTMVERPESYQGPRLTARNDPRITRFGAWLRESKLNELPQLWNILVGEMSLVGPRPEDPEIGAVWPAAVREEILSIRPGMTSPASVLYRNEESMLQGDHVMEAYLRKILPSKLRLDQLYVRNRSVLLDLDILLWTFLALLPRVRVSGPGEDWLFLGPLTRLIGRYMSWFVVDMLVTFVAIGVTGLLWRSFGPLDVGVLKSIGLALGFATIYSVTGALMGINRIVWSKAASLDSLDLLPAITLSTVIALLFNRFWNVQSPLPTAMILVASFLAAFGFVIVRYQDRILSGLACRWIRLRGNSYAARERVLIVGGGESGQFVAWWLQNSKGGSVIRVVGYIDDDLYLQDTRIRGVHVLGKRDDIPRLVKAHDIGIIIFAIHNIPPAERDRLLAICRSTPARVVMIPDIIGGLREMVLGNQSTDQGGLAVQDNEKTPQVQAANLQTEQVIAWLAELDQLAASGDFQRMQSRIHALKQGIIPQSEA
jgi:lipopolysaccharide/colanic/teichoic acid biosynthesis glycosyltransferase